MAGNDFNRGNTIGAIAGFAGYYAIVEVCAVRCTIGEPRTTIGSGKAVEEGPQ